MNVLRLLVLGLAAVLVAVSANLASAGTIPQSPILLTKQVQETSANILHPGSFDYPAAINLKIKRETKSRRTQVQTEWHDKAEMNPVLANPPTLQLEVGTGVNKAVKTFKFEQLHLHRRAEHLESQNLNNVYSMELHMVHKRDANDGLPVNAAVGRFINLLIDPMGPGQNPNFGHNPDLKPLFDGYGNFPMGAGAVANLALNKLVPAAADFQYYRYSGSLTAPQFNNANETADVLVWNNMTGPPAVIANDPWLSTTAVEWVMFEKPLTMSLAQWAQYSSFIFGVDNHFGAHFGREDFEHLFAVWKQTPAHDLRYVPEPGIGSLLAIAGMVATLRMKCRETKA